MVRYRIQGGGKLNGLISVSGNKNSILPLMAASIVTEGKTTLRNVPSIRDVEIMAEILQSLGATVSGVGSSALTINTTSVNSFKVPHDLCQKLRASIILLGPLLARFQFASIGFPGGDTIGKRALGTHLDGLVNFGADFEISPQAISGKIVRESNNTVSVFLDEASVTATENIMIYASRRSKEVILENAACEPHVTDLANFLIKMGAKIDGIGSNKLRIRGTEDPCDVDMVVGPDYVDAGTFAIAAAITGGQITIKGVQQSDLRMTLVYLSRFGVKYRWLNSGELQILSSSLAVNPEKVGVRQKFQTRPWPGFPTDLMSPLIVLATQANGSALLHDWMYETRMFFTDKLVAMGANITLCDPHRVIVTGKTKLYGKYLISPDIRAGMSFLLASLVAEGQSLIDHAELIERGYEDPVKRLVSLGGKIESEEAS